MRRIGTLMKLMTWNDWNPYQNIAPWTVASVFAGCLILSFILEGKSARKMGGTYKAAIGYWSGLLIFYIFTILCATLFGRSVSGKHMIRPEPFWSIRAALQTGKWIYWYYIAGNILLFVPFGYILPHIVLAGRTSSVIITILSSLLFSCIIEIIQYITGTGLCEADDLIHNTIGGEIGSIIWLSVSSIKKIE